MSPKRLLLLSYHFPPGTAPGALRWEKLAAHVVSRGIGLDVITSLPRSTRDQRPSVGTLPPDVRVFGVHAPGLPIDDLERMVTRLRGKIRLSRELPRQPSSPVRTERHASLAPEAMGWTRGRDVLRAWWSWRAWRQDLAWARVAVQGAIQVLDASHRAIITCGPPHLVHREGARFARAARLPLVMDLRDPWSFPRRLPEHLASPLAFLLAGSGETEAIREAQLVVANTEPLRSALAAKYPESSDRMVTVMNGWDEDPVPASTRPEPEVGRTFRVAYAGSVYLDRSPLPVFAAARQVIDKLALTPIDLQFHFVGPDKEGAAAVLRSATSVGIAAFVSVEPRKPRADAMAQLAASAMLLNLAQDSAYAIPSKLFEYLRFPTWILALSDPGTPSDVVLADTDVDRVGPGDIDGIARVLEQRILMFRRGERPGFVQGRDRLSRTHQAEILMDRLKPFFATPRTTEGRAGTCVKT